MKRTPYAFQRAYANGRINELGYWEAVGRSARADTELKKRLELVMIKRERKDIWAHLPTIERKVIWCDINALKPESTALKSETHYFKTLEKVLKHKINYIIENVMESLLVEEKVIIWVLSRNSVEIMAKALDKATESHSVRARMREVHYTGWATHGEQDYKGRYQIAAKFREHEGAAAIIATMDSMPESISLFGATTAHYAQLHYLYGPMEQTSARPLLSDTAKLTNYYYVAKHTIEEQVLRKLLPRLEAADKVVNASDAQALTALFAPKKEDWDTFVERLTADMPDFDDVSIDYPDAEEDDDEGLRS